jgi:hypothetical protein
MSGSYIQWQARSMTLNVTKRVSGSSSMLYPKCTDMIQARITKRFRLDSSATPRNKNHGSEKTVWRANCWHYVSIILKQPCLNQQATREVALFVPGRGKGKARAANLSPCTDTHTTDEPRIQDSGERVRTTLLQHYDNFHRHPFSSPCRWMSAWHLMDR